VLACWGSNEHNQLPLLPGIEGTVPPGSDIELIVEGTEYRAIITIPAQTVTDYVGLTYSSFDPYHFALVARDGQQIPVTQLEGLITVRIEYLPPKDPHATALASIFTQAETLKLYVRSDDQWVPIEALCQGTGCSQQVGEGTAQMVIDYLGEFMLASSPPDHPLTVNVAGSGSVSLDPPGGAYTEGTQVELTAVPAPGWQFKGWSGDLSGTTTPISITIDAPKTVTATFSLNTYALTVAVDPAGSGTTSPAAGVQTYAAGTIVNLTATPNAGHKFDHWGGACTGTGACQVKMNANKSVICR
jgi:uncharacterized repeat protein (TIGR02543 family)